MGTPGFDANAIQAWDGAQGYGAGSVVIAIIDSGVDTSHPDLNLMTGYDFGSGDSNPMDDSASPGHGTACAGVAAAVADNALGVAGTAGACVVMPLKVADNAGTMAFASIINAINYAASHGADVISMSFGAALSSYSPMDTAMQNAFNAGVVLLAATGNENASTISYPANSASVIAVGAASPCGDRKRSSASSGDLNPGVTADPNGYTCDGERWWGSNYGLNTQNDRRAVDIIAPTILPTTDITGSGGYTSGDYEPFFNGTSCATPYAAGVCALIKSANPTWNATQIRDQLRNTAQDIVNVESGAGWDRYSGYGMVDAAAAVGATGPIAPSAAFSASPTSACAGDPVGFTDESTGDIDTWAWDFGDGGTSTATSPSYAYAAAGTYDVTLTVTGPAGGDSVTRTAYITVGEGPTGGFTAVGDHRAAAAAGVVHRQLDRRHELVLGLRRRRHRRHPEPGARLHRLRHLHRDPDRHQRLRLGHDDRRGPDHRAAAGADRGLHGHAHLGLRAVGRRFHRCVHRHGRQLGLDLRRRRHLGPAESQPRVRGAGQLRRLPDRHQQRRGGHPGRGRLHRRGRRADRGVQRVRLVGHRAPGRDLHRPLDRRRFLGLGLRRRRQFDPAESPCTATPPRGSTPCG